MKIFCVLEDRNFDYANVIGYAHSEEWAQQICLQHNKKILGDYGHWTYEAADPLMTPLVKLPIAYAHEIIFDRVSDRPFKFRMRNEPDRYTYFEKSGKLPASSAFLCANGKTVKVVVSMNKNNRKLAEAKAKTALVKFVIPGPISKEFVMRCRKDLLL